MNQEDIRQKELEVKQKLQELKNLKMQITSPGMSDTPGKIAEQLADEELIGSHSELSNSEINIITRMMGIDYSLGGCTLRSKVVHDFLLYRISKEREGRKESLQIGVARAVEASEQALRGSFDKAKGFLGFGGSK